MAILNVANEAALKGLMIATESTPGVFKIPTQRMGLDFTATPGKGAMIASADATGTYDRTARVRRSFATPSGNIGGGALSFQELAILSQYALKGGVAGVADANAVQGYTYTFNPSPTADDIETFSALFGVDGLPWEATGVRINEFNIAGNAVGSDDFWTGSGTLFMKDAKRYEGFEGVATGGTTTTITMTGASWTIDQHKGAFVFLDYGTGVGDVRQVLSNTATALTLETAVAPAPTAGMKFYISAVFPTLPEADFDTITMEGTKLYLDLHNPSASSLGTTDISERVLSFNVTQQLNLANKRRLPGVIGRIGRGAREVTGTIQFEYDRWDEYKKWIEDEEVSIRIEKLGPIIDPTAGTRQLAQINIERAAFDDWTEGTDQNNMTVNLTFRALQNTPPWQIKVVTDMSVLP